MAAASSDLHLREIFARITAYRNWLLEMGPPKNAAVADFVHRSATASAVCNEGMRLYGELIEEMPAEERDGVRRMVVDATRGQFLEHEVRATTDGAPNVGPGGTRPTICALPAVGATSSVSGTTATSSAVVSDPAERLSRAEV